MKIKSLSLLLILVAVTCFTILYPSKILLPFYYLKDLVFLSVHAIDSDFEISDEVENSIINSLKNDIKHLEEINNIDFSISDFNMINATVISRNRDYWYNTLTINKGIKDGVDIDMAVIDSQGLIGRISSVTSYTSVVKLLTTNDVQNKVSAVIHNNNQDIYGIINGYDSTNNLLHLIVTDNIAINKLSIVETTGMGGVFPSGILIGKVYDMVKKDDGITNIVRIIPSSNIKGERYVAVLSRNKILNN